ncbi:IclR family transcriptional regulator [Georgenia thermotolerans]|uniref:IclR family transcriptional regulator n=1 Tax=Georgenia thermotolerans TaxID=527326 RepID=UPI001D001DAD|nr:IclR family transcriptional regulator [Georgenia thermotolerans]
MAGATTEPAGLNGDGSAARSASVIANVFDVLRCFTVQEPLQGVTEIAAQVGLHKSSVSRILATLEREGIVERDDLSRKFRLGLGLLAVAGPLLADLDVRRVSLPMLRDLSAATGESAALVLWDGAEAVTVEQVPSAQNIKHTTPLGTRYASPLNASVQVFLAELPDDTARARIEDAAAQTGRGADELLARLHRTRERGFAVNYGDTFPEEVGISAPVRDHRGETVAAVLLAAPLYRVDDRRLEELGRACAHTAAQISARLGAVPA